MTQTTRQILFLTHVGQPGGAEFVMLRLCSSVRDHARVLHFAHGPLEQALQARSIASSVLAMPDSMAGVKRGGGMFVLLRSVPAMLSMLRGLIAAEKTADVIVCMSQKSFALSALAKPFVRKPIVWFMNDLVSSDHFSKPIMMLMTRLLAPMADHIVVNSQASYEAWIKEGGRSENLHVLYPGSDVAAIDAMLDDEAAIQSYRQRFSPDEKPVVGIFGRISHWKGQDIFLKALVKLKDVRGVIVGDAFFGEDSYHQSLKDYIAAQGLADRIVFAGHVDDVPRAMAACDVVVHASTQPEPFGLVIAEAMLTRKPVIVSNAGGAREVVEDGISGLRTPPSDADALASAIHDILSHPEKAKSMAIAGRQRAENLFSNDRMIAGFKEILERV